MDRYDLPRALTLSVADTSHPYTHPQNHSHPVTMSSHLTQSSAIIRAALVLETVANIGSAIFMLVLPNSSLAALGILSHSIIS